MVFDRNGSYLQVSLLHVSVSNSTCADARYAEQDVQSVLLHAFQAAEL